MALRERLLPWDSQPQDDADVSPALGHDAILWSATRRHSLSGAVAAFATSEVGFGGLKPGPLGISTDWSRVVNAGANFGTISPLQFSNLSGVTIAVVAAPGSSSGMQVPLSQRYQYGGNNQITIAFNSSPTLTAEAGGIVLYARDTAARTASIAASAGGLDGQPHCWVAGNGMVSGYIYRDGEALTLTTDNRLSASSLVFSSSNQQCRVGNLAHYSADSAYVHVDPLYLVIAWPRLLPANEAQRISSELARNIGWAFAPQRIFSPTAIGGGTGPIEPLRFDIATGRLVKIISGSIAISF